MRPSYRIVRGMGCTDHLRIQRGGTWYAASVERHLWLPWHTQLQLRSQRLRMLHRYARARTVPHICSVCAARQQLRKRQLLVVAVADELSAAEGVEHGHSSQEALVLRGRVGYAHGCKRLRMRIRQRLHGAASMSHKVAAASLHADQC